MLKGILLNKVSAKDLEMKGDGVVKAFELKKGLIRERFAGRLCLGLGFGL